MVVKVTACAGRTHGSSRPRAWFRLETAEGSRPSSGETPPCQTFVTRPRLHAPNHVARRQRSLAALAGAAALAHSAPPDAPAVFRGDLAHTGVYRAAPSRSSAACSGACRPAGRCSPHRSSPTAPSTSAAGTAVSTRSMPARGGALAVRGRARHHLVTGRGGGLVYVGSRDGAYVALDAATGARRWRMRPGPMRRSRGDRERGPVYRFPDRRRRPRVRLGGSDGQVWAVDAATGTVRWRFRTEGRVRSSPAVAGGRVYVGSMDGTLYALEPTSGRLVWRFDTGPHADSGKFGFDRRTIQSSPAVVGGTASLGRATGTYMPWTRRPAGSAGPPTTRCPGSTRRQPWPAGSSSPAAPTTAS